MNIYELEALVQEIGFSHWAPVNMEALVPMEQIRSMCREDRCNNYNRSWSCPPSPVCGSTEDACRKMHRFEKGILVQCTGETEDQFDLEAIRSTENKQKQLFDTLVRQVRKQKIECLPMTSGGCRRCYQCTWPNRPCRHPEKLYPSMEAYGLWVSDVCKKSGLPYNYGENTITFTACLLIL